MELKEHSVNNRDVLCVIASFRREVEENCPLLGHYAASSCKCPEERSFQTLHKFVILVTWEI